MERNIYKIEKDLFITSDEEIKEGDYVYSTTQDYNMQKVFKGLEKSYNDVGHYKKIILTTDQDLIKDGVQEIDAEFLEWFVNNPNCEFVMTIPDVIGLRDVFQPTGKDLYKIIIPIEESTFYTKKCKCMIFEPTCFTGMCKNCGGIPKEETKPKTMLESLQEYFKNTSKEKVLEDWNEFQHLDEEGITVKEFLENQKQETLEQAAEKYSENWEEITGLDYENTVPSEVNKLDFINGAKWQMNKQDEFTLGFLHWYNTSQECETYLRRNYPKNITMNGEHYKKVLQINKELLEMYKNTLPR